jgi:hypothetical protein
MSMPNDAINAIVGAGASHLWVMNETSGTTFVDQVATNNKPLTAASGCTPGTWSRLPAGYDAPQTPTPNFDGSANAYASGAGASLGGLPLGWSIMMWMQLAPGVTSPNGATFYCERGSSGTDLIKFYNNAGVFNLTVADDTVSATTSPNYTTSSPAAGNLGLFGVSAHADTSSVFYLGSGRFGAAPRTVLKSNHTWTNSGVQTYIGMDPNNPTAGITGTIGWVATFPFAFTDDQWFEWYQLLYPTRPGQWKRSVSGAVCPNSNFWNDKLSDTAPLDPNSSNIVTQWVNYGTAHSVVEGAAEYVTMYDLDTADPGPTGCRSNFYSMDQHHFLATVPTPDRMFAATLYPGSTSNDGLAWAASPSRGIQWDAYQMAVGDAQYATDHFFLWPPWITSVVAGSSGTLASGIYYYSITAVNSNGESVGRGVSSQDISVTVGANGSATVNFQADLSGSPGPTSWRVYRRGPYASATGYNVNDTGLLTTLTTGVVQEPAVSTFVDDGSFTPDTSQHPPTWAAGDATHSYGQFGTAMTATPGSIGGGGSWDFLKNCYFNPDWRPSGFTNNGESATSCPAGPGTITVEEALNNLIPHPIAVALPNLNNYINNRQFPAHRNDGYLSPGPYPMLEGMRLRLPAGFDPTTVSGLSTVPQTNAFQQAIIVALRDYGMIVRDSSSSNMLMYLEYPSWGQNPWNYLFGGLNAGGSTSVPSLLPALPWSSMQVLLPFRHANRADGQGRRTNRTNVAGKPTPLPY